MANRRYIQRSTEDSAISEGLTADIERTNTLSRLLDAERDAVLRSQGLADDDNTLALTLKRLLSVRSTTSTIATVSSFAKDHQEALHDSTIGFRKIGFGQCGLVFERPGRGYVVKICKPGYSDGLWADCVAHDRVQTAFDGQTLGVCVPHLYAWISKGAIWWDVYGALFPPSDHTEFPLPCRALLSERILALPKVARSALIEQFCPEDQREAVAQNDSNRDCLARVYLGRRSDSKPSANFTLRNFNMHLDQMISIGAPVIKYAEAIAEALAVIHWQSNVDAFDIEFVLGSEPLTPNEKPPFTMPQGPEHSTDLEVCETIDEVDIDFHQRTIRLWVLDFNLCNCWEEKAGWENPEMLIDHLVFAFFENDPYYPLPLAEQDVDRELWSTFRNAYLGKASEILTPKDKRLHELPIKFMDACVERERQKLAEGRGHGSRDHKQ